VALHAGEKRIQLASYLYILIFCVCLLKVVSPGPDAKVQLDDMSMIYQEVRESWAIAAA